MNKPVRLLSTRLVVDDVFSMLLLARLASSRVAAATAAANRTHRQTDSRTSDIRFVCPEPFVSIRSLVCAQIPDASIYPACDADTAVIG